MNKIYELIQKPAFLKDAFSLQKSVQKKVVSAVEALQRDPFGDRSKKIQKHTFSNLYRYRIGDHRIVYAVGTDCISILAVGHRRHIYDRFNFSKEDAALAKADMSSAEPKPIPTVPDDVVPTSLPEGDDKSEPQTNPPEVANAELLRGLLDAWQVPSKYHKAVLACSSAEDILDLEIPENLVERILHIHSPPTVEQLVEEPNLELPAADNLQQYLDGTLSGFLLRLDPDQARFARRQLKGPTLVKGGAGTGKSLVALYRIRNLLQPEAQADLFSGAAPRVLFLTYTKALTLASEQLLKRLTDGGSSAVDVMTLDALAAKLMANTSVGARRTMSAEARGAVAAARATVKFEGGKLEQVAASKAIEGLLNGYLVEEFDWIIDGRGISSLEAYLEEPRSGRGTRFTARTRRAVWSLYREWQAKLEKTAGPTFTQVQKRALERAQGLPDKDKYDVVVIDEAQDLKPVGIRLAVAMCRSREGLYLTADDRQTIYGRGYSWKQVAEELDFRGRTAILKRNYRTTAQIQDAANGFLKTSGLDEEESRAVAVLEGPKPWALDHKGVPGDAIASYFKKWANELQVPVWASAVLVRSKSFGKQIVDQLDGAEIPARWVDSKDLELDSKFVKVMTMHSAKGLEFPMVCVAGVKAGELPSDWRKPQDEDDAAEYLLQERRLFHVAMTRAMRRLLITFPGSTPSKFIADLETPLWEWQTWQ